MQNIKGILLVRPISARLDRDTEMIGSMDCFCRVMVGSTQKDSHVHKKSGKTPTWQSQLSFKIDHEETARIAVWDKELVKNDDLVGECEIDLIDIFQRSRQQGIIQQNLDLFFQENIAGNIHLEFEFLYDGPSKGYKPEKRRGMVVFQPTHAILEKDTENFGQMDPYVVISIGESQKKTKVHDNGGKNPKWNDVLEIRRNDEYFADIKVYDKDVLSSDLVGEAQLCLQEIFQKGGKNQKVEIFNNGQISGNLYLQINWMPDTESRSGTLIAHPISATLVRDIELVGKMDPYVVITIGKQQERTQVQDGAGKNPRWGDELQFQRESEFEAIIDVYDQGQFKDDIIGSAHVALQDIFKQGQKKKDIELFYKEKQAGTINIKWEWHPDSEFRPGIINVKPISANLLRDTDTFSKMDPFVEIRIGESQTKSQTAKGAGKNPKWKDDLVLRRKNEHFAEIFVYDEDNLSNDLVGQGKFALYDLFNRKQKRSVVILTYKNKQAGTVTLEWQWKPDEELKKGRVIVKPLEAVLERDTEFIGKMDCFTSIKIGKTAQKTETCQSGGKVPHWNSKPLTFQRNDEYEAIVQVWDEDVTTNDLVGEAKFSLFDIFKKRQMQQWINIFYDKSKIAGKVLIDWEWLPEPSAQDTAAENRVRFINVQNGYKNFGGNMSQYMLALHNFDKLTLDDDLYQIFEGIVTKDLRQVKINLRDLIKSSEYLKIEGYAELCQFFLDSFEDDLPEQKTFLKLISKFKKQVQLSEILKTEIENLTSMPCCYKSIEILEQQIQLYETSPNSYKVTPYRLLKNELEMKKAKGDYSRLQILRPQVQQKNYSNNINQIKDQHGLSQSRQILQKTLQGNENQKDETNFYYNNNQSRLKVDNKPLSQDIQFTSAKQQEKLKFKAQDWLKIEGEREIQTSVQNKQKINMYDQYQGDIPKYEKQQLVEQNETLQKQSQAQFWVGQQKYYDDPQNLPFQYQTEEKQKQTLLDRERKYREQQIQQEQEYQQQNIEQQQQLQNSNQQQYINNDQNKQQTANTTRRPGQKIFDQQSSNQIVQSSKQPFRSQYAQQSVSRTQFFPRNTNMPEISEENIQNSKQNIQQSNQQNENQQIYQKYVNNTNVQSKYVGGNDTDNNFNNNNNNNNNNNSYNNINMAGNSQSNGFYQRGNQNLGATSHQNNKLQQSQNQRVKKERTLFQSLFW